MNGKTNGSGDALDPRVAATNGSPDGTVRRCRRIRSGELVSPEDDLIIEHAGKDYRLRVTRKGKLILTA